MCKITWVFFYFKMYSMLLMFIDIRIYVRMIIKFLNHACAGRRPAHTWLLLSTMLVCVCVCVCLSVCLSVCPEAMNLYDQLNKFVAFRNLIKLSMHWHDLCNEALCDRNQSNVRAINLLVSLRWWFYNGCTWVTRWNTSVLKMGVAYAYQGN